MLCSCALGPVLIAWPDLRPAASSTGTRWWPRSASADCYESRSSVAGARLRVGTGSAESRPRLFGIAGAEELGPDLRGGKPLRKVPQRSLVETLFERYRQFASMRAAVRVRRADSREGAEWVARGEVRRIEVQLNAGYHALEDRADGCTTNRRTMASRGGWWDRPSHPSSSTRIASPPSCRICLPPVSFHSSALLISALMGSLNSTFGITIGFLDDAPFRSPPPESLKDALLTPRPSAQSEGQGWADPPAGGWLVDLSGRRAGGCSAGSRRSRARILRRSAASIC